MNWIEFGLGVAAGIITASVGWWMGRRRGRDEGVRLASRRMAEIAFVQQMGGQPIPPQVIEEMRTHAKSCGNPQCGVNEIVRKHDAGQRVTMNDLLSDPEVKTKVVPIEQTFGNRPPNTGMYL